MDEAGNGSRLDAWLARTPAEVREHPEALGPLPPSTPAADADRQQALVATNLAWRGAADPARQAARDIRDAQLRGDIEQRLLTLAALQTNAEDRQILATR